MKKTFVLFLCLIPLAALSQKFKPLDSLALIKFGSNRQQVVQTVKAHNGIWDVQHSRPQYYVFLHITFDDKSKSFFTVKFSSGKAYEINYIIETRAGLNVLDYYCEVIQKLSSAYGKPKSDTRFNSPCKNGDKNQINAIRLGMAHYSSYWPAGKNSIIISIDIRLRIILTIQDDELTNKAFENQSEVN